MAEIKIELYVDEEVIKELFEEMDIKYSKKKFNVIKEQVEEADHSAIEEALDELVREIIGEEYGE